MSNMYFYLRDLDTERKNMSEPPVPKLQQLQIREPGELCACDHERGLHHRLAGPCYAKRCACQKFRPADDQQAKACAATGSR